jgi:hypothetical protein
MKKRVLFVESDPSLLQLYVEVLDDESDRWEVFGATDAAQALDLMEHDAFARLTWWCRTCA